MARQAQAAPGAGGADAADASRPAHRGLKIAVIVMGVLLVVGFTIVFSTIVYRAVKPAAVAGVPSGAPGPGFAIEAARAGQARIGAMSLEGDRLAVELSGADGSEIVIFDVRRGRELGRIRFAPR